MVYSTNSADVVVIYLANDSQVYKDFYWSCGDDVWLSAVQYHDGTIEIFPDISAREIDEYLTEFEKEPDKYEIIVKGG